MKKFIIITSLIVIGFILVRWIDSITGPPPDPFHGVPTDKGKVPTDAGMPYVESKFQLGETTYYAMLGGSRRDGRKGPDWDYYFVWIHKQKAPDLDVWYPFYSRWMSSKRVSADLESVVTRLLDLAQPSVA